MHDNCIWTKIFINAKNTLIGQVFLAHFGMGNYILSIEKWVNFTWSSIK